MATTSDIKATIGDRTARARAVELAIANLDAAMEHLGPHQRGSRWGTEYLLIEAATIADFILTGDTSP